MNDFKFEDLTGLTLTSVEISADNELINLHTVDGRHFRMYHRQDCCESVSVEDVCGEIEWLIGTPILKAEEVIHDGVNPEDAPVKEYQESWTWTFYRLTTEKGLVVIRWYGESNGYYSESVDMVEVLP